MADEKESSEILRKDQNKEVNDVTESFLEIFKLKLKDNVFEETINALNVELKIRKKLKQIWSDSHKVVDDHPNEKPKLEVDLSKLRKHIIELINSKTDYNPREMVEALKRDLFYQAYFENFGEVQHVENIDIAKRRLHVLVGEGHIDDHSTDESKQEEDLLVISRKFFANIYKKYFANIDDISDSSYSKIVEPLCGNLLHKKIVKPDKLVGLALSGGGIRSAAFNLGVLQATNKHGFFKCVDYLSTVSGGGYIGSSLTRFLQKEKESPVECSTAKEKEFPFECSTAKGKSRIEKIRCHASYLTPGSGLNVWSLAAAAFRGIFMNLFILIPIFLLIVWFLTFGIPSKESKEIANWPTLEFMSSLYEQPLGIILAMIVSIFIVVIFKISTVNDELSKKMENLKFRFRLWFVVVTVFLAIYQYKEIGQSVFLLEDNLSFVFFPLYVFGVAWGITSIKWVKGICHPVGKFTEIIEIMAWCVVFWLIYICS